MGSLGSLCKGKEQSRGGRPGWANDRGFRKGLEKEPVQNLESDVVRELLSAASADGEDPESQWRREDVGDSDGLRSNRANGREEWTGSSGGSTIPAGIVRASPEEVGAGCGGGLGSCAGPTTGVGTWTSRASWIRLHSAPWSRK